MSQCRIGDSAGECWRDFLMNQEEFKWGKVETCAGNLRYPRLVITLNPPALGEIIVMIAHVMIFSLNLPDLKSVDVYTSPV